MKDHNVAAGLFLAMVLGGLGWFVTVAIDGVWVDSAARAEATKRERDEVRRILRSAVEYGHRARYKEAIGILDGATEKYGQYSAIWLNLGIAQRAEGDLAGAARSFQRALKENPKDWDALAETATVQKLLGQESAALASLERIPAGRGRVKERLEVDPVWGAAEDDRRLSALREKHRRAGPKDTSIHQLQQMEKRRRQFQHANGNPPRP